MKRKLFVIAIFAISMICLQILALAPFQAGANDTGASVASGASGYSNYIWYLAEGSSKWGFETYIYIQNPNDEEVEVEVIHYPEGEFWADISEIHLPAMSQTVLHPQYLDAPPNSSPRPRQPERCDFSTTITCLTGDKPNPIAVDRRMVWTGTGAASPEGHSSVGVTAPSKIWYLPEGSSKWGFETWLMIQNPNSVDADCVVTYMIEGEAPKGVRCVIPRNSRGTFSMASHIGSKDASISVTSNVPVIAERAMYRNNRREGHGSIGTTQAAYDYYLAEGAVGYPSNFITYILVQNPNDTPAGVTLTYMTQNGVEAGPSFQMPANSRKTIRVNDLLPAGTDVSTKVTGSLPVIAERAMYWNDRGAGTNTIGGYTD